MSIVAVHGPNTFGSMAVAGNSVMTATVDPANGLIWTIRPIDQSQVAANYDWAYTPAGGSPASPLADTKNPVFTFTGAVGSTKTVTLTLNGVAQPPLVITIPPSTGGASLLDVQPEQEMAGVQQQSSEAEAPDVEVGYDPAAHTVAEVEEFVTQHPDEAQAIYDAEVAGKNRATLISWLEESTPYDPGDYTVAEVEEYVTANPELAQDVLDAEESGKNRVTLVEWLEDLLTSTE